MKWQNLLPFHVKEEEASDDFIAILIRAYRNKELAASDWTQLPDVDLANKPDWTVYRQALRDMMAQNEDPKLIVFPEPPK
tara:strand:+ start:254 stop:493 length:240 start_codon:yes stop_codon:yes gene_type:complete